jgi:ketosteroid isomerase-like protein
MSASNVELLAQGFAGWGKEDPANMRDVLHSDCELVVPDSIPYGGTFRGTDAVIGWFTRELWRWLTVPMRATGALTDRARSANRP